MILIPMQNTQIVLFLLLR